MFMKSASNKQSKQRQRKALDERQRRIRRLIELELIKDASEIPDESIPIDPDLTTPTNLRCPAVCYMNIEFTCSDCGKSDCWTAASQQHYFEVSKASPYKRPKRCYDCRQKELARKTQARVDSGHKPS